MKKVLFVLVGVAAMSIVACNPKNDCACDILDAETNEVLLANATAQPAGSLDMLEYDGECADITWNEYTGIWKTMQAANTKIKCVEKK